MTTIWPHVYRVEAGAVRPVRSAPPMDALCELCEYLLSPTPW
jgi:hypothetical protein